MNDHLTLLQMLSSLVSSREMSGVSEEKEQKKTENARVRMETAVCRLVQMAIDRGSQDNV
jgi:hypothetical protein